MNSPLLLFLFIISVRTVVLFGEKEYDQSLQDYDHINWKECGDVFLFCFDVAYELFSPTHFGYTIDAPGQEGTNQTVNRTLNFGVYDGVPGNLLFSTRATLSAGDYQLTPPFIWTNLTAGEYCIGYQFFFGEWSHHEPYAELEFKATSTQNSRFVYDVADASTSEELPESVGSLASVTMDTVAFYVTGDVFCLNSLYDPGEGCELCVNGNHSWPGCNVSCVDEEHVFPGCNVCRLELFEFPDCEVCIDSNHSETTNCTKCDNPKHLWPNCESCANELHTNFPTCDICEASTDHLFPNCTKCAILEHMFPNCSSCANERYKYPACERCNYELYDPDPDANCEKCLTEDWEWPSCAVCAIGRKIFPLCTQCDANWEGINCTDCPEIYDQSDCVTLIVAETTADTNSETLSETTGDTESETIADTSIDETLADTDDGITTRQDTEAETTQETNSETPPGGNSLNAGDVSGIVVGSMFGVFLLILVLILCTCVFVLVWYVKILRKEIRKNLTVFPTNNNGGKYKNAELQETSNKVYEVDEKNVNDPQ